jgi:acetoin utilization protein AcuB
MTQTVGKWMSREVQSTGPDSPLISGIEIMAEKGIRHVLDLADGDLCGILSNRDLVRATMLNPQRTLDLHKTTIKQVMTKGPLHTTHALAGLTDAAAQLVEHKISALPVVGDDGQLVGILTSEDVLRAVTLEGCSLRRPDL